MAKRQRNQYGNVQRRETLRAWQQSGQSAEVFAARMGIAKSNLWRRARRYRDEAEPQAAAVRARAAHGFAPVHVVADTVPRTAAVPERALMCELDGPCGLRLRVYQGADTAALQLLLDAVRGGSRC